MDKTSIYYYSGTGNSLQVARGLASRLKNTDLIPLTRLLGQKKIEISGKKIGLVTPCHALSLPIPVTDFLRKARFIEKPDYFFCAATRAGSDFLGFEKINRILRSEKIKLNAGFILTLPNNDPKFDHFRCPSKEEFMEIEKELDLRLDEMAKIILEQEDFTEDDHPPDALQNYFKPFGALMMKILVRAGQGFARMTKTNRYFYSDEKCTSCGICEKVCPSGKIKMVSGKPVWQKSITCYMDYSCLNYCPSEAVQIKSKIYMKSFTPRRGRYSHPWAKVSDITAQKTEK